MSFFSKLFGGPKIDPALAAAFEKIKRVIEDDEVQLQLVDPKFKALVAGKRAVDQVPGGTGLFGFSRSNPIPANGPIGELAYLSSLETRDGDRLLFHRLGSLGQVDVFETVSFSGAVWNILYLDMYFPRKSRSAPEGFRLGQPKQFSGFNSFYSDFPYDFAKGKQDQERSGLSFAYIPLSNVTPQLESRKFSRPADHVRALELVKAALHATAS